MRKQVASLGIVTLLLGVTIAGEILSPNSKPLSVILQQAEQAGLSLITEAKYDDGVWEIEGLRGEQAVELHLDPASGSVLSEHADTVSSRPAAGMMTAAAIVQSLEQAGYAPVLEIDWEQTHWEAEGMLKNQRRKLQLDGKTGKILSDRFDQ